MAAASGKNKPGERSGDGLESFSERVSVCERVFQVRVSAHSQAEDVNLASSFFLIRRCTEAKRS